MADTIPSLNVTIPGRVWLVSPCANCGYCITDIVSILFANPGVMNFALQGMRLVSEPYQWLEYEGQQVIRACLTNITSAERLIILVHPESLEIVAMFKE